MGLLNVISTHRAKLLNNGGRFRRFKGPSAQLFCGRYDGHTARRAHLLILVRVQPLNDDLPTALQRWYPISGAAAKRNSRHSTSLEMDALQRNQRPRLKGTCLEHSSTDSRDCTTNVLAVPNTGYSRTCEYNASGKVVDTCP